MMLFNSLSDTVCTITYLFIFVVVVVVVVVVVAATTCHISYVLQATFKGWIDIMKHATDIKDVSIAATCSYFSLIKYLSAQIHLQQNRDVILYPVS